MPAIAFLAISYWPGVRYLKSDDENAKRIGIIATVLMIVSTVVLYWLTIVWTQQLIQSSMNAINLGGLNGGF